MLRERGSGSVATISCSVVRRGVEVGSVVDRGGRGSGSDSSIISRSERGGLAWVAVVWMMEFSGLTARNCWGDNVIFSLVANSPFVVSKGLSVPCIISTGSLV